jgi:hypothetical protein
MPRRRRIILCCSLAGLALAAPWWLGNVTHRRARGEVREVLVTPMGDGRARLSVVYDFAVGDVSWLGWEQDDGWLRAGPDPVLPLPEALRRAEELRGERRHAYPVLYRANDPSGTAFISLRRTGLWTAMQLGVVCVLVSLILSLPIPLPFLKVDR